MKSLDYEIVIGNGSFSTSYKVCNKNSSDRFTWKAITLVMMRNLSPANLNNTSFIAEINLLRQLRHCIHRDTQTRYIVMEYCEDGDLGNTKFGDNLKQFSESISDSLFRLIPGNYSNDLRAIISFLLSVDNEIRPSIKNVLRHSVFVHHVSPIYNKFLKLIPISGDKLEEKLSFTPNNDFSNTVFSKCTSTLRSELFGAPTYLEDSTRSQKCQISSASWKDTPNHKSDPLKLDPDDITKNIFNDALKNRLKAIKAQESLLKQKEANLREKEIELNDREKRLTALEKSLDHKKMKIESTMGRPKKRSKSCAPRKQISLDDTYCTIEPYDTKHCSTIAKLDLATMPPLKALSRKVTFKSPQKLVKYDIEKVPLAQKLFIQDSKLINNKKEKNSVRSGTSTLSKTSDESGHSQKRRSILSSIFRINSNKSRDNKCPVTEKVEVKNLGQIWTLENKKAAFEKLAAMNASNYKENEIKQNSLHRRRSFDRKTQLRKSMAVAMEGRHQIFI